MTQQNPITPSPELRAQWRQEAPRYRDCGVTREDWLIDSAAQWGLSQCCRLPVPAHFLGVPLIPPADCIDSQSWIAMRIYQMGCDQRGKDIESKLQEAADQELEACCLAIKNLEWFANPSFRIANLRAARRTKPKSLKEQALDELDRVPTHDSEGRPLGVDVSIIRRAIESIPDPS